MDEFVFNQAIDWIEAHPEQYDQRYWVHRTDCGTSYCLAGVIAMQANWQPVFQDGTDAIVARQGWVRSSATTCTSWALKRRFPWDSVSRPISSVACELLKIDKFQAATLFNDTNTLDDIKRLGKMIANGEL